ncbi:MAG: hypothetical protein P1U86_12710 [Verrucomicrobiales bacterium]|nr:hypothetical protein [Verrucomicrobiales bacterium]
MTVLLGCLFEANAFDPALQDDSQALVRHFKKPPNPVGPAIKEGSFVPNEGETISLMGGADVYLMRQSPDLDIAMLSAWKGKKLRVRNLGWSADTVYRQQRPMYFYTEKGDDREGSVPDLREKIDPGTMILMFGKMESLDGEARLSEFVTSYEALVSALKRFSERIVLVAPIPFSEAETPAQPGGDSRELAEERNVILAKYTEAIRALAERQGVRYFDSGDYEPGAFSGNGLYLSETGQRQFAVRLAKELGWKGEWHDGIEEEVRLKNQLWHQYYRPTNWAFLFGDRQSVPSSRDNEDPSRRWFEEEIQEIPSLIEASEKRLWKLTEGIVK